MKDDGMILAAVGGGLFLILAVISALVFGLSCKLCRVKGPSTIGAIGINILLLLLWFGAMVGIPYVVEKIDDVINEKPVAHFAKQDVLEHTFEAYQLGWLNFKAYDAIPSIKLTAVLMGMALPVLMLFGAFLIKLCLKEVTFSQGLTVYFVFFLLFLAVFLGTMFGFELGWQEVILAGQ